jgi:hypothetical protein
MSSILSRHLRTRLGCDNDQLRLYTGTDRYYEYMCNMLVTNGAKAMADMFQCYWFLDIIASYHYNLKHEEFQVWELRKIQDSSALVICTDGNDRELAKQDIPFTDFKADTATLWVEAEVILLPSEH